MYSHHFPLCTLMYSHHFPLMYSHHFPLSSRVATDVLTSSITLLAFLQVKSDFYSCLRWDSYM